MDSWVSGGETITVTTQCNNQETHEECCERHDEAVDAAMKIWPPD